MPEDLKTNTPLSFSSDSELEAAGSELPIIEKIESEPASANDESVQMRAAREIMREYADTLKMLADS
jgi:hypothetical protein